MDSVKLINDYIKQADWRINENANMSYSYPGMLGYVVGHSTAEYGLSEIYPFESSKAHKEGFIHIHDLSGLCNYSYFGKETVYVVYKGKRMYLSFEQLYDLVEEDEVLFNEKDSAYVKYPIDLKVKDKGSMVNVSRVVKKKKQHNLHYIKAKNGFAQIVTSNHPIITTDGDIPAKDVNENHIIETFYETLNGDVTSLNIVEQISTKFDISNYTVNGKSYDRDTNNNGQVSIKNMHCTMNSELELNPDLGWLLGMMIAEGSTNHNSISLSQTSGDICTKIIDILNRLNVPYQVDSINNVNNIRIKSKIFANLYISMFGNKRSNGKCLPVNFVEYNKDFLLGIVAGICDGDGSKNENSVNKSRNIKIRMTSRTLLNQIAYILRSVGINARDNKPYFNEQSKTGFKSNFPVYTIVFTVENGALPESIKCNSIKNKGKLNTNVANSVYSFGDGECNIIQNIPLDFLQVENVYDITTSTQQFICNGILSHNCLGLDFEMFLYKGINDDFGPPKHFTSAISQLHNAIFLISQQIAGAVAFNSVDILLAPYMKNDGLTYKEIKQSLQEFVCTINIKGRVGYQCVDKGTEVLTPQGFKKYNELNVGDDIYTWKDGKLNIQKVKAVTSNHHKGKMHVYKGRDYIQQVTDNHRVLFKKNNSKEYLLKESKELFNLKTPLSLPVAFSDRVGFTSDNLTNEMRDLLVFVLTEGTIEKGTGRVRIFKSPKRWGNERLEEILEFLGLEYSVSERRSGFEGDYIVNQYTLSAESSRVVNKYLNGTKKEIPSFFFNMNREQARMFLNTWAKLDGYIETDNYNKTRLQCDNDNIADAIQHIAVIAGYGSNITERVVGNNKQATKYVCLYQRQNKSASIKEEVDYDDIVWCPSTDDGIVVYRKDGKVFISGNSPFTNFQLDVTVPKRLQGRHPVIAGNVMDFTYDDCKWEIECINKALLEIMMETKKVLAFPVINIGIAKDFNWDNKLAETIFTSIGNTGQPTINNYVNSCYDPDAVKSMCCSLRLDMAKIMKQTGGSFGAADNSGSTGVVTLDLPVYGYLSGGDEAILKWYIQKYTKVAFTALVAKRKFIEQRMKDGWYPTVNRFIDDFSHFFNTIGVIGLHEMLLNMGKPGIDTEEGSLFAQKVLDYINELIGEFQVENKDFYGTNRGLIANLELVPGEGCCHRLALHNKKVYPEIITQGSDNGVYYTRGCWLPANKDYNLVFAANNQDALQEKFSGGANFQYYLNEPIHDWKATRSIVRKLVENTSLPFISLSPTISVCPICGRLQDNKDYCQHDLTKEQIEELEKKGVEVIV